ncbi:hypothetical protein [Silvimonas iriomotensis]|uniref:hypothetical protein n=1 Tax=Silvimonas iriomotensis TaxID=449662 RepID=UPI0016641BE6|nr:hypothetical protein [Silvimonas iriomotensis]
MTIGEVPPIGLDAIKDLVIVFPEIRQKLDVGRICFADVAPTYRSRNALAAMVMHESLDIRRIAAVERYANYIYQQKKAGKREYTIRSEAHSFITFCHWTDRNSFPNPLVSSDDALLAAEKYFQFVKKRIVAGEISAVYGRGLQFECLNPLEFIWEEEDFRGKLELLSTESTSERPVELKYALSQFGDRLRTSVSLFNELYDFLINFKPFPHALNIQIEESGAPQKICIIPQHPVLKWHNRESTFADNVYCKEEYRIRTVDEIAHLFRFKSEARKLVKSTQKDLDEANSDPRHRTRMHFAQIAIWAFLDIFIAVTAMNPANVFELPWIGEYKVTNGPARFKSIKYRANRKEVHFVLATQILPIFKKYLEIRSFFQPHESCNYLFFQSGRKKHGHYHCNKIISHSSYFKSLKFLSSELKNITYRDWRRLKSVWGVDHFDSYLVSRLLQNDERTLKRKYGRPSRTQVAGELTDFFGQIVIVSNRAKLDNARDIAIGECSGSQLPEEISKSAPISPNCTQPEGCLFCRNYVVIPDEKDVRKLLSCLYVINTTKSWNRSSEELADYFDRIISRIKEVVNAIGDISPENKQLINEIQLEVDDRGMLDPYRSGSLERLIGLWGRPA